VSLTAQGSIARRAAFLLRCLLAGTVACAPAVASGTDRLAPPTLAACIRDPGCHRIVVVAHRGLGPEAPDNSRQAVAAAVAAGVPVIEVDVRQSSDGELFIFHDGKIDGAAAPAARIEDLSAQALGAVRLRNGETLPRLVDIHALARGRALLVLDVKSQGLAVERVADWLAANDALDDALLFLNTHEEMVAAARVKRRHPRLLLMVRLLDTRITLDNTRRLMGALPEVLHTDRLGAEEVAQLHALGVKVWMNAIELEKYMPPFRSFVLDRMLRARPDFVLSMDPVAMMRRLARR
jgi:glycerophosphoryl diester phosphodiesterase